MKLGLNPLRIKKIDSTKSYKLDFWQKLILNYFKPIL